MAKSINQVILLGNLTRDPVSKIVNSKTVAEFSLALNREYLTKDQEYREAVDYIDVVVWGKQAENAVEYLRQGDRCLVQGRFQARTWEDKESGKNRSKIEVLATDLTFFGKRIEVQSE